MPRPAPVYVWQPQDDSGPTKMDVARPEELVTKSNTGNAAKDGYSVVARRLRGDLPGDIMMAEEADRIEAAESEYPMEYPSDY